MVSLRQRPLLAVIVFLAWVFSVSSVESFCCFGGPRPTMTGVAGQARLILYGRLANAQQQNDGDGTTDLVIEMVLKNELAGKKGDPLADPRKKTIRLDRDLPAQKEGYRFLVFCDVFKGQIDPYRGLPVLKNGDAVKYLLNALQQKDEKIGKRLRFFFDYLDNPDPEISNDAFQEFGNADYKDYREMAKSLPAERVAKWLKDDKTPASRYGLYASLLGHCGNDMHAKLLHDMLENPAKHPSNGVDGMLDGYVMLKPKAGWAYTRDILKDSKKEFMLRYAALRTVRFLWDSRPDLVSKKELIARIALLLDQSDISDIVVDDLRKRKCWDMTNRILSLRDTKMYKEIPIVRRAVLRFALSCKGNAAAVAYVADQRKQDAEKVADAEALLKLEQMPITIAPAK